MLLIAGITGLRYVGGISSHVFKEARSLCSPLHISDWPICVVVTNTRKIR